MAKAISIFKISGTIDALSFRQTEFGMEVGCKPGPSREKVLTADSFELTRRNANEFKLAIKNAKLLRKAFGEALKSVKCSGLNGQVNGLLYKVGRSDEQSLYGYRHAVLGDVKIMEGFEFNKQVRLQEALPVAVEHSMDVTNGHIQLRVPVCIIRQKRKLFPQGATHVRIVSCAALVDFEKDCYAGDVQRSGLLPLHKKTSGPIELAHRIATQEGEVLVHAMGIEFYKVADGQETLLKGGALKILAAARFTPLEQKPVAEENSKVTNHSIPLPLKDLHCWRDYHFTYMPDRVLTKPG